MIYLINIENLRTKIMSQINQKPNIKFINIFGSENAFDESSFYNYLHQEKELIYKFILKYKIKNRFIFKAKIFDDILVNYQSFNFQCLLNVYNIIK